jgi:hypothetical protein
MTAETKNWMDVIQEKLGGLRYGQVLLTVHDGRVVQIERTEKTRLESSSPKTNQPTRED